MKTVFTIPYYFTSLLLFCITTVNAQDILWEKSYGGKHAEYLFDAVATPDYGFILAGSSVSKKTGTKNEDNQGDLDYWVWKMDEKGNQDWQKSLGGSGQDRLKSVVLTRDGGYLLAGSSDSSPITSKEGESKGDKKGKRIGNVDFWIVKLNAKGGEEWQKTLGGKGHDELNCIVKTKDGGYIIGGSSSSESSPNPSKGGEYPPDAGKDTEVIVKTSAYFGNMDYWVIRMDGEGTILWQKSFGGIYNDELRSIALTDDGGFLLGGSSNSPVYSSPNLSEGGGHAGGKQDACIGLDDYWIIKLDKDGEEEWQKVIGGSGDDQLQDVHQTQDGNYLLAGYTNSDTGDDKKGSNEDGTDFWLLKLDKTQVIVWQETYNIGKVDVLTSLVENNDGSLLLGGYAQGEILPRPLQKRGGSGGKNASTALGKTKKGTNAETSPALKKGTGDYVALKLNAKGEELWRREVGSAGNDVLKKVFETRDGGYLMAGTSSTSSSKGGGQKTSGDRSSGIGRQDFWVVKLKDKQKPKEDKKVIEAFPNPTRQYTNVIVNHEFETGTATVFDIMGRQLQQFDITDRTVAVDLGNQPEGVYIIEIATNVEKNSVKIIKGN
jgi:hypothetical protein